MEKNSKRHTQIHIYTYTHMHIYTHIHTNTHILDAALRFYLLKLAFPFWLKTFDIILTFKKKSKTSRQTTDPLALNQIYERCLKNDQDFL